MRRITVVILLPEVVTPELTAELPKSDSTTEIISLPAPTSTVPEGTKVHGVLWIPPADKSRLVALLEAHSEIEWLHCLSAGVDYLADVIRSHVRDSPICVSNGRGAFSSSLAEYVLASALYFNKQFKRCEANRQAKHWDKFIMNTMAGKTMGFVGYGHIAQSAQALAAPFGLRFVALRRHPEKAQAATEGCEGGGDDGGARPAKKAKSSAAEGPSPASALAATYGPESYQAFYSQVSMQRGAQILD